MLPPAFWQQAQAASYGYLEVRVLDPNGANVPAKISIQRDNRTTVSSGEVAPGAAARFQLPPGNYKVVVQKQGFYSAIAEKVTVVAAQVTPLEVNLHDVRQHSEEVDVAAQTSPIDPQQTAAVQTLTSDNIINIPYPSTRDYRNLLRFIPGVIADTGGQIHVAGGATEQTQDYLDGFEVSSPGGGLALRLNPESLRKINVESSRYSAQYGKGSAGLASFDTQDGDNQFRWSATDFFPTFQNVKGLQFNNWTPRASISGPIVQNKAWFLLSHEGEQDHNVVKELPEGADTNSVWRTADLAKIRFNPSRNHALTFEGVINLFDSSNTGISLFTPVSVSSNQKSALSVLGAKDQMSFGRDNLLEFGAAAVHARSTEVPLGPLPETLLPSGSTGNFYRTSANWSDRKLAFSNVFFHPLQWHGTHQLVFGGEFAEVRFHQNINRKPVLVIDGTGLLSREISFTDGVPFTLSTAEPSLFVQDRWSPVRRLIVEAGLRWDRDSLVEKSMVSPRVGGTYLLDKDSETKLSAGVGIYYDRTNFGLLARPLQGSRIDQFFDTAFTPVPPSQQNVFVTSFTADPRRMLMPRFVNWSAGVERRLPGRIFARFDYISRTGQHGWGYEGLLGGVSVLQNNKEDRYHAAQITLRTEFKHGYPVMVSYSRSLAHTNEVIDFGQDNTLLTNSQIAGPQPWDAPNQVVSWGYLPLPSFWKFRQFKFAYSSLWRTGFPFLTTNQFQQLVDGPGAHRFPDYFTLNPAIEKQFSLKGYSWSARVGIDNVTNSLNPAFVDNNVNSPTFLTFSNLGHRSLNGRIRLLGKN
jgi:hypothetical protein